MLVLARWILWDKTVRRAIGLVVAVLCCGRGRFGALSLHLAVGSREVNRLLRLNESQVARLVPEWLFESYLGWKARGSRSLFPARDAVASRETTIILLTG